MPRIGVVTHLERDEILRLHERRTALSELLLTLGSPDLSSSEREALKADIDEDLIRTNELFESWWQDVARNHHLTSTTHGKWMIDFETRELSFEPTGQDACQSSCSVCPTEAPA